MKRLTAIVFATIMMFSSLFVVASAAGDTISTATSISLDRTYSGSITSNSTIDYYKFV